MNSRLLIISVILFNLACSGSSENEEKESNQDILGKCTTSETRMIIEEPIPAKVNSIDENDYFFNENRLYLEVDAETYLPELADQYNLTTIRVFAPGKNLEPIGREYMFKGTIVYCITTDHGRLTNNLWNFYLVIEEEITNN